LLLLRAIFEIPGPGKQPVRRKNVGDPGNQVNADGLMFGRRYHGTGICRRPFGPANKKVPRPAKKPEKTFSAKNRQTKALFTQICRAFWYYNCCQIRRFLSQVVSASPILNPRDYSGRNAAQNTRQPI